MYKMNFKRLLHTDIGKNIISVILGLGLASLFRKVCNERNCLVFKGPAIKQIDNQIFKFNNKCYSFTNEAKSCDKTKKQVSFA